MKPYIKFYPSPPRCKFDRTAITIITVYAASGFISLGIIGYIIHAYLTK